MGALGGMRRNVEVKARLRARAEALAAALRLRGPCGGLPRDSAGHRGGGGGPCPGCPGTGQEPPQVCPRGRAGAPPDRHVLPSAAGAAQAAQDTGRPGGADFLRAPRQRRPQTLPVQHHPPRPTPRGCRRCWHGPWALCHLCVPQEVLPQSLGSGGSLCHPCVPRRCWHSPWACWATVRKERLLLLLGQTRLHLDRVQGLGDFLELEVVLRPEQSVQDGQRVAQELLRALGVPEQDLVCGAYLDLLLAQGQRGGQRGQPAGTAGLRARRCGGWDRDRDRDRLCLPKGHPVLCPAL
ncbi:uncharacterized protein LOC134550462 isoform X1 [Prinia subflava]|uniref:uncharacterized protein LOC134550462 isoform X1 n=1 Tax=Prinia subflava TaxID=208062 RepID=UPI002FE2A788